MKKINKKGFFLSETMVVMAVVAVVVLSVFKLFTSIYYRYQESESYNTPSAINALSNVQKYYESLGNIDTSGLTNSVVYLDLTNSNKYESNYYTRLKSELNINSIYLINLNNLFTGNNINTFNVNLRKYLKTLQKLNGTVLVIALNDNQYAYNKVINYSDIKLVGDEANEYAVYVEEGDSFVDPGYINWNGDAPIVTAEEGKTLDTSTPGIYYLQYNFNGYILRRKVIVSRNITKFYLTKHYEVYTVPYNGYYNIELYGASGNAYSYSGAGAYTSGIIKLNKGEKLYVYVGGIGESLTTDSHTNVGGYNGGGYSGYHSDKVSYSGGGATDIRLVPGEWNNDISLNSRIMVAAGGAATYSDNNINPGNGGTLIGGNGATTENSFNTSTYLAKGATQTGPGYAYEGAARSGSFGFAIQSTTSGYGGGGGGGYYGGSNGYGGTGSGGSSFISGYSGVNAITSSTNRTHTNNTLHYSGKYFLNGNMQAGKNPYHASGEATITYIGETIERNDKYDNVRYVKDCINGSNKNESNHWIELQVISEGVNVAYGKTVTATTSPLTGQDYYLTAGGIVDSVIDASKYLDLSSGEQCLTVDLRQQYNVDEIAVWHYWSDGRIYNNHSLYVSSDNTNWTTLIDNVSTQAESLEGIRVNAYN